VTAEANVPAAPTTTQGIVPGGPTTTTTTTAAADVDPAPHVQPTGPPPFAPVTFEGENGTLTGSAGIWDGYPNASGGRIVRNLGNWGGTPGTLTITGVNIPSTALHPHYLLRAHRR
jgi:hypothetical protein